MHSYARTAAVAAGLLASTAQAFDASSSKNVAMYWGQGSSQVDLSTVCADPSIDIVNLAFVDGFPVSRGDYPMTNFANACGSETFNYPNGTASKLLSNCPTIEAGITACQTAGKKVLLSVGGGWPTDYTLPTDDIANYFADFLYGAFGPYNSAYPRPFGNAAVDGFDLDIESLISPEPFAGYQYAGYATLVNRLRSNGAGYISGAPQCVSPDAHLADAIKNSLFDFIFVQFYNTAQCNSRVGYNEVAGVSPTGGTFTFDAWVSWLAANSKNGGAKIYLGLPASTAGAPYDTAAYLKPEEANTLVSHYAAKYPSVFGGVMLWEATANVNNQICNKAYASYIKDILTGSFVKPTCATSSSSVVSSTATVASSTVSSATATSTAGVSPDGTCGTVNGGPGYTCKGYFNGECCSSYGYCGGSDLYCSTGCNPLYGNCPSSSSSSVSSTATVASSTISASASASATPTGKTSPDGTCGTVNGGLGYTCKGYFNGECCSSYGFCGSGAAYCGDCNPLYGNCPNATSTISASASATATSAPVSPDGSCGTVNGGSGYTCKGYFNGECCSSFGYCGGSDGYCGTGCNPLYGNCASTSSSSVANSVLANATSSVVPTSTARASSTAISSSAAASSVLANSTIASSAPVSTSPSNGTSSIAPSSISAATSLPYPTGTLNATSGIAHPTGGSSSVSAASSLPYPTGTLNATSTAYQTGAQSSVSGGSSIPYPTGGSSAPYPTGTAASSGAPYPTGGESESSGAPYPTGSGFPTRYLNTSVPCTTSTQAASSSQAGYGGGYGSQSQAQSSSNGGYGGGYGNGNSSPVPTTTQAGYGGGYGAQSSPVVTGKPSSTVTVVTTSYVDVCSTGLTTILYTTTLTVCPICEGSKTKTSGVPEGWTTTVTVCNKCGPVPTTVTLTKPVGANPTPPSNQPGYSAPAVPGSSSPAGGSPPAYTQPAAPGKSSVPAVPAGPAYTPQPGNSVPAAAPSSPANSKPASPAQSYPAVVPSQPSKPEQPNNPGTQTAVSTVVQVVTLTKSPVPATSVPTVPAQPYGCSGTGCSGYNSGNSTKPAASGTSTGKGYGATTIPFEGAANHFSVGVSAFAVIVAAVLAL